jgi:hypothetical protein
MYINWSNASILDTKRSFEKVKLPSFFVVTPVFGPWKVETPFTPKTLWVLKQNQNFKGPQIEAHLSTITFVTFSIITTFTTCSKVNKIGMCF